MSQFWLDHSWISPNFRDLVYECGDYKHNLVPVPGTNKRKIQHVEGICKSNQRRHAEGSDQFMHRLFLDKKPKWVDRITSSTLVRTKPKFITSPEQEYVYSFLVSWRGTAMKLHIPLQIITICITVFLGGAPP
jgi:hypothetical protein